MKKTYVFICLFVALGLNVHLSAQVNPGLTNLKHQWTFDDGTAKDYIGNVEGTLQGAASIKSKALSTADGGWMEFPGSEIAVNSYPELTVETWFTSVSKANGGCTMLAYFGNTTGDFGTDYLFKTPAGCSTARLAMSCGNTGSPWSAENGIDRAAGRVDDGMVHHLIATVKGTEMNYYIDGQPVGTTTLTGSNALSALGTQFVYLAKGGYKNDPTWKGMVHKFSIYNKALIADEILYLFQRGAESTSVISASIGSLAFDDNYPAESFTVSSSNLTSNITVTAPAGITVEPSTIPANTNDVSVVAYYNAPNTVDGNIVLKSGSSTLSIPVKSVSDAACFVPLYDDVVNLVPDPGVNLLANFSGWGTREVVNIINNPSVVYCGASSMKVGNGNNSGSGSLDVVLTDLLAPNTTYRVKAMVKTVDGTFQLGVWGYDSTKGDLNNVIDTHGEWQALDFYFTTGETLKDTQGMFWNNSSCTGKTGYIDNWEMYIAKESIISVSQNTFAFDPEYVNGSFTVAGTNLTEAITITAPAGITVEPASLPVDAMNALVTVTYNGTTPVNGNIELKSGATTKNILVKATSASNNACFDKLIQGKTNLIPDPFCNDQSKFGGWGAKEFVSFANEPDSVYCGSHTARIFGSGSLDVNLVDIIKTNTSYKVRFIARTLGGDFQIGVGGIDVNGESNDVDSTFNTDGAWQHIEFDFTTGDSLRVNNHLMFINNWKLSGTRCYIDNIELYESDGTSVKTIKEQISNIYIQNNRIVTEFESDNSSAMQLSVYGVRGELIYDEKFTPSIGFNTKVINAALPSGIYVVKLSQNGQFGYKKLIK